MDKKMYSVQIGDEIRQYEAGTTYRQIAAEHQKDYEDDIVLVFINDRLQELHKTLEGDCFMRICYAGDSGQKTYRRSMCLMLVKAIYDVCEHQDDIGRSVFIILSARAIIAQSKGIFVWISNSLTR